MPLGHGDLQDALRNYTRRVYLTGTVDTGATNTVIPILDVDLPANIFKGLYCHFITGGAKGVWRKILSNDVTSLTLENALLVTPSSGDQFAIIDVRDVLIGTLFEPKSAYGSSTGAAITVDLDTGLYGGRTIVEVWVKSSAAATFTVYGSRNGTDYRKIEDIILGGAGEEHRGYQNAYRYIRVSTSAANNNECEIVASR